MMAMKTSHHAAIFITALVLIMLGFHVLARHAQAQTIPAADVNRECRARYANSLPANTCILHEQRAYDYVIYMWGSLAPGNRHICMQFVGEPFMRYQRMAECVWRMHVTQRMTQHRDFIP